MEKERGAEDDATPAAALSRRSAVALQIARSLFGRVRLVVSMFFPQHQGEIAVRANVPRIDRDFGAEIILRLGPASGSHLDDGDVVVNHFDRSKPKREAILGEGAVGVTVHLQSLSAAKVRKSRMRNRLHFGSGKGTAIMERALVR